MPANTLGCGLDLAVAAVDRGPIERREAKGSFETLAMGLARFASDDDGVATTDEREETPGGIDRGRDVVPQSANGGGFHDSDLSGGGRTPPELHRHEAGELGGAASLRRYDWCGVTGAGVIGVAITGAGAGAGAGAGTGTGAGAGAGAAGVVAGAGVGTVPLMAAFWTLPSV
jgi:hypothetical protein